MSRVRRGLIFVGMMAGAVHSPEEGRFVQELSHHFEHVTYLYGVGVRGLGIDQLKSLPRRLRRLIGRPADNDVPIGSLVILPPRQLMRAFNIRWLRNQLSSLMRTPADEWTVWLRFPSPELIEAIRKLPFSRIVYEPVDAYAVHPIYTAAERRRILAAEHDLCRIALVIAPGRALSERFQSAVGGGHWLPLGIEGSSQKMAQYPWPNIGLPRILVMGALDWRLDQGLLAEVARTNPAWQLVLAGPTSIAIRQELRHLTNVHWLGPVPTPVARSVIAGAQVALIPYRLTDWTRASLPLKLFDYLAEGKPVVATQLPELVTFADVVRLAGTGDFVAAIDRALRDDSVEAASYRRKVAERFTVQRRTSRVLDLIAVPSQPGVS